MKPARSMILAAAFFGGAFACALYLWQQPGMTRTPASGMVSPQTAGPGSGSGLRHAAAASNENGRLGVRGTPREGVQTSAIATLSALAMPVLSEAQWREQAAKVEMEANHELERLVELLDLDGVQQDKIFSALAQGSSHWLPGMQIGGGGRSGVTAPPSTGSDLSAYLSPSQQQALAQEDSDRQAWWAEVLPQLLPPSLADAGTSPQPAAGTGSNTTNNTATPAAPTKEFEGNAVLVE